MKSLYEKVLNMVAPHASFWVMVLFGAACAIGLILQNFDG